MSDLEAELYKTMKDDLVVTLKGEEIDATNAAALSGKLCQMANGAIYGEDKHTLPIHEQKLDALEDLIEGANGKPVLVAYWFKHDLAGSRSGCTNTISVLPPGHTGFHHAVEPGRTARGMIHPASAGHGLNLQAGVV